MRAKLRRAVRRPALVAVIGMVVLALGVSAGATVAARTTASRPTPTTVPAGAPVLTVAGSHDGHVAWDAPLTLRVRHGRLLDVTATGAGGVGLAGLLSAGGTAWRSVTTLVPTTTYTLVARVADGRGDQSFRTVVVSAADAERHLLATISPGDGNVVGVGMPVSVRFNRPVAADQRAAVVDRLAVASDPPVTGGWRWMSPTELHWRPADYWPAGITVTVSSDLEGLDLGDGLWGSGGHLSAFRIGDAHISVADAATHTMTVTSNGRTLRVLPMSAGRDQYPSRSGVHIALEKSASVTMDSATVGIPRDSPDGYFEKVAWDVRISYGGAFVHAAPWSVRAQGQRNVSHGCINLSTADAEWFYRLTLRGDIVDIRNAAAPPDRHDPGMSDWNIPWSQWRNTPALVPPPTGVR
jgi:lipoprotein-anchoring transpeptidase ErfK/SrfK